MVEASGADGLVSYFEGEINAGAASGQSRDLLGLQFLTPREASSPTSAHFVYGDSRRWLAVRDGARRA